MKALAIYILVFLLAATGAISILQQQINMLDKRVTALEKRFDDLQTPNDVMIEPLGEK